MGIIENLIVTWVLIHYVSGDISFSYVNVVAFDILESIADIAWLRENTPRARAHIHKYLYDVWSINFAYAFCSAARAISLLVRYLISTHQCDLYASIAIAERITSHVRHKCIHWSVIRLIEYLCISDALHAYTCTCRSTMHCRSYMTTQAIDSTCNCNKHFSSALSKFEITADCAVTLALALILILMRVQMLWFVMPCSDFLWLFLAHSGDVEWGVGSITAGIPSWLWDD
jgi:hypothetical protein